MVAQMPKKGGSIKMALAQYPATLRPVGKDSRSQVITIITSYIYETLLGLDVQTLNYTPNLATHWKISEDKMSYWFRLDPNARWHDGNPVVADDIVQTWKLLMDDGIEDPSSQGTYGKFKEPVAESKYIVRVDCTEENWRNLLYISNAMQIFPAHHLKKTTGAGYLKKYQYNMMPGTGPYELDKTNTKKGEILVIKRVDNYWAKNYKANFGANNFDKMEFVFILDEKLKLEKFKAGEFDYYEPGRAQWWVEELNAEENEDIARGLIQKKKIFNFKPLGTSGFAFNTLEEPFNDIRVREAFGYLWNIEELNNKLFFNEYIRCRSYYQNSVYENPHNVVPTYNPEKALKLLADAGWTKKEGDKWLTKNGKPFDITVDIHQSFERILTPLQQDLEQVGIKMDLNFVTPQTRFERLLQRKFKISFVNWTGLFFPNPETSMHSRYAEELETNNVSGIKSKEIDALCERYDKSYDVEERIRIIQQIDSIAVAGKYVAFGWVSPYSIRTAYWNKFDMPEWGLTYTSDFQGVLSLWWVDPDKEAQLEKAKKDKSIKMKTTKEMVDYWGSQKKERKAGTL